VSDSSTTDILGYYDLSTGAACLTTGLEVSDMRFRLISKWL
jgi:hypothetical protein